MFNNILAFSQKKLNFLYENSFILQNIDKLILPFILLTYVFSTFADSDSIGFFALIVMFLTAIKILVAPKQQIKTDGAEIWLILYFMLVIVSLCGSTLFVQSFKGFLKTFIYIGFYFSVAKYLKDNLSKIPLLLGVIGLCTFGESLIGIFQSTLHLEQISTWQDTSRLNPEEVISRIYGTLKPFNPNLYGGYLVSGLAVLIGSVFYFLNHRRVKLLIGTLISVFAAIYAILQTGCRGAYMAVMIMFVLVFLISAKFFFPKYKKWYLMIVGSAVAMFTAVLLFVSSLRLRFLSIFAMRNDSSNSFRFNVYHSSLEMLRDNWLLGIGVGNKNFREIYGLYMKTGFDALSCYNVFLEIAVESGVFALIAFLGYLISLFVKAVRFIKKSTDTADIIFVSVCIVGIFGMMFHGLVDTVFFRPQLQFIFWTYTAVIAAIMSKEKPSLT